LLLNSQQSLLYTGFIHSGARVTRKKDSPYYVSKEQLSRDILPNYCAGPCYVMSRQFVVNVVRSSNVVPVFRVEDAYMGVVAEHLGVQPQRSSKFVWERSETFEDRIRTWNDKTLYRYVCVEDKLKTETIEYLHFRYMQLD